MSDNPQLDINDVLNDLSKLDPTAEDLAKRTRGWLGKIGVDAKTATTTGGFVGAFVGGALVLLGILITVAVTITTPLVRIFLRVLTKARTDTVPEQVEISSAVLSEFLAAEIDPSHLKTGKTGDQTIDAARAIGKALHDRLTKEFVPGAAVTPESGEAAAQTFSGYAINFAVQNTMIGTLADALSVHLLEDFRELGVDVARNIGLGRLVRLALQPLIRNTIQEPYDQALRKKYRPDILSEQHAVSAFSGGAINGTQLHEVLARKGWNDDIHGVIIDQLSRKLDETELSVLFRHGRVDLDFAIKEMGRAGITPQQAGFKLTVKDLERADSIISTFKAELVSMYVQGFIDQGELADLLGKLPLSKDELALEIQFAQIRKGVPRAFLTWAEVEKAFELGAVDLYYVDKWLARRGFSEEDVINKELLMLAKLEKDTTKDKVAAGHKTRKTTPKPQ